MSRWSFESWIGLLLLTVTGVSTICSIHLQSHSEDEYCTGCWNVSHCQHSGLRSPRQSYSAYLWNDSWVQTFHKIRAISRQYTYFTIWWPIKYVFFYRIIITISDLINMCKIQNKTCVKYKTILTFKRGQKFLLSNEVRKPGCMRISWCWRGQSVVPWKWDVS